MVKAYTPSGIFDIDLDLEKREIRPLKERDTPPMLSSKPSRRQSSGRARSSGSQNSTSARIGLPSDDIINAPGVFIEIPTESLKLDPTYQRSLASHRIQMISQSWSWVACGVLTVALRQGEGDSPSGDYYLIDGQHRVAAAKELKIPTLPCLVFESKSTVGEASGFLEANTARRTLGVLDRYRALLTIHDPVALKVKSLLDQIGRNPYDNSGRDTIKCLDFLMRAVEQDQNSLETIWPLMAELCEGRSILKAILSGFFYIERYLSNSSITERLWRRRILQVGYDAINRSIAETVGFEGKSGSAVCARGILRALNRGLRNKLTIQIKDNENDKE